MSCFPDSVFAFWSFIHEYARHSSGEYFFMHFHCLCHSTLVCALDLRFALPSLIKVFPDNPCLCLRLDQFPHSSLCWPLSAETIFFFWEHESHVPPVLVTTTPHHCSNSALSSTKEYTRTVSSSESGPLQPTGTVLSALLFPFIMKSECYTVCSLPNNAHPVEKAQEKPHHSCSTWWFLKCLD